MNSDQPETIGYCRYCGAPLKDCVDWPKPKWIDGDPDCLHELEDAIDQLTKYKY